MCHEDSDVEVPHVGLLIHHQLRHFVYLEAAQLGLRPSQGEFLAVEPLVDGCDPLTQVTEAPHVSLVASEALYRIAEHLSDDGFLVVRHIFKPAEIIFVFI